MVNPLKLLLGVILYFGFANLGYSQYYLAVNDNNICNGQQITFTAFPSGNNIYKLFFDNPVGADVQIGGNQTNDNTFDNVTVTTTGAYYVIINIAGTDFTTNSVNVTVNANPTAIGTYVNCSSGSYVRSDNEGAVSLLPFMTVPGGHTITYSGLGVFANSFYPSTYVGGQSGIQLQYTLRNSAGCTYGPVDMPCTFNVANVPPPPPAFLQPVNSLPYCENGGNQAVLVDVGAGFIINSVVVSPAGALVSGPSTVNYHARSITVDPSANLNYNIKVTVTYHDILGFTTTTQDGYLTVLPRVNPQITGLPAAYYGFSYVGPGSYSGYLCKSNDTLTLSGYPSQGRYKFYKVVGGVTTVLPNGVSNIIAKKDTQVVRFVPNDFFKDSLGSVTTSRLIIKFGASSSGSSCPDTISYDVGFATPYANSIKYSIATAPPYCYGDTLSFNITSNIPIQPYPGGFCGPCMIHDNYTWSFGDGNTIAFDTTRNFKYLYNKPGEYLLRFKAMRPIPAPQCYVDSIQKITIGVKPKADFEVKNPFEGTVAVFKNLTTVPPPNTTVATDTLHHWDWYFGDGTQATTISTANRTKTYAAATVLPYEVSLVATTSVGCKDSLVKDIPIFPILTPGVATSYTNDFESTTATGWYQSGMYRQVSGNSSWKNIIPNGTVINSTEYNKAWITSKIRTSTDSAGYFPTESSWVETPAFQLTSLTRPMLSFNTWGLSETQLDGASVQYTLCDTTVGNEQWYTLGKNNAGLNWYNYSIVIAKPGGEYPGWSSSTGNDWMLSSYALEEVKDSAAKYGYIYPVRFRVAFNSNAENAPGVYDGFAFDNFYLGQRNRKVMVEEFCDYNNFEAAFNQAPYANNPQMVRVQYHTRYMNLDDEINNQNKGEAGARNLLYGYSQLPRAAVDGYYSLDFNKPFFGNSGQNNFEKRILEVSPYTIAINAPSVSGNALQFSVDMTRNSAIDNTGPFVMQVVALEKQVVGNGKTFTNVFRKFLPDASGEHVDKNDWPVGTTKTLNRTFTPFTSLTARTNPTDTSIVLVAFVQDEATSEVYQSEAIYVPYSVVQSLQPTPLPAKVDVSGVSITLYPNPAQNNLMVYFENGKAPEEYQYRMIDGFGKTVKSGQIPKDATDFTLYGLQDFPVGMYQLQLLGNSNATSQSFSIVR